MSFNAIRKLPTFRFDENRPEDVHRLPKVTAERFEAFLAQDEAEWLPPVDIINSIIRVNSRKREKAFLKAIDEASNEFPPQTTINSIMNYGGPIPGVSDRYLDADYPSHEVFAYIRLGKRSMLNRKFGEKCIEALQYAYPGSIEVGHFEGLRARVHRVEDTDKGRLAVVSTKETIDNRQFNGRTSLLISRVTGVARLDHADMTPDVTAAIESLAEDVEVEQLIGAKALLADYIESNDDSDTVVPVIQTIYQTQR